MKIPLFKLSGLGDTSANTTTNPTPNWFQRNWEAATGIGIGVIALLILLFMSLRKPRRKSASLGYVRRPASSRSPARRKRAKAPARKRRRKTANTTSGNKRRKYNSTTRTKRKPQKRKARV